jgi:U4/U6 small nuclear ribonucleoprotein PRP4
MTLGVLLPSLVTFYLSTFCRQWIASYSIPKARERIARLKEDATVPDATRMAKKQEIQRKLKTLEVEASQIADTRPISWCSFSPDSKILATGSWSGLCKLWSVPDCRELLVMRGHQANIGSVVFHPRATLDLVINQI